DHTFGKGTVQAVEDLPQKLGGLKTTIGLYFTPGGESTQNVGVESDIVFSSALTIDEFGEKTLDYSLPPKKIKPFLSAEAFVAKGRGAWDLIDQKTVRKLNEKSQARIKKDPDFKKILDDIAKAKKKKGDVVVLSEF